MSRHGPFNDGSGLRLMECVRLRVQDLDFSKNLVYVRTATM